MILGSSIRWAAADLEALEGVLRRRAGLLFTPARRGALQTATNRLMQQLGVDDPRRFVALLEQDGATFDTLMAEVTVGETYFFRDPAQFDVLRQTIVPGFKATRTHERRFRAWSAGCASGEEAYSIAITLREQGVPADVLGTDISRARLVRARGGRYGNWSLRGVPHTVTGTYFRRDGNEWVLDPEIRRAVEFRYLNLAVDVFPCMSSAVWGMDLILCRNVLIYFDRDTVARVAASLVAALSDDGWLLLGATDPPIHELISCEVIQTAAGLAYRRAVGRGEPSRPPRLVPPLPPRDSRSEAENVPVRPEAVVPAPPPSAPREIRLPGPSVAAGGSAPAPRSEVEERYEARDYEAVVSRLTSLAARGTLAGRDWVLYVRSLANLGRLEEAGRACAAALDRFNYHPELHYLHAVLVDQAGRYEESARAAKRALYLDRSLIVAHLALGTALSRCGDYDAARRAFAAAERLLAALAPNDIVPASDGEPAARLLEMTRMQSRLAERGVAA